MQVVFSTLIPSDVSYDKQIKYCFYFTVDIDFQSYVKAFCTNKIKFKDRSSLILKHKYPNVNRHLFKQVQKNEFENIIDRLLFGFIGLY